MKRKTLGVMLAIAAAAPAVVVPRLVAQAQAQDAAAPAALEAAEFPDVPRGHWAYNALNKLSQAGIIEGLPDGTYAGNKPMTRYEFAVAIARLLDKGIQGPPGPPGPKGEPGTNAVAGNQAHTHPEYALKTDIPDVSGFVRRNELPDFNKFATKDDIKNFITRDQVNDLIAALRREFQQELERLGVRVDALEGRVSALEGRIAKPPRTSLSTSVLHRQGTATYISKRDLAVPAGSIFAPVAGIGRNVVRGNNGPFTGLAAGPGVPVEGRLPAPPHRLEGDSRERRGAEKYSYTDVELRLTDRITDRLSATAALRAMGNTQEDPWAGETGGGVGLREAYFVADLSDRSLLGIKGLTAIGGRQHTKWSQGLLYNNDLSPTDQAQLMFSLGPVRLSGFIGASDGNTSTFPPAFGKGSSVNPYLSTGAVAYLGANGSFGLFPGGSPAAGSGATVGFPGASGTLFTPNPGPPTGGTPGDQGVGVVGFPEANESGLRASFDLFRIGGQPVGIGYSRLLAGVQDQKGDAVDLTIPLFNRTVGIEYVRQLRYFGGAGTASGGGSGLSNRPTAFNVTVPVLRTKILDLDASYGRADDSFEFFVSSSANPFARTYAEAVFDRPMALGAPLINGAGSGTGEPKYMAVKRVYDVKGTVRLPFFFLKRLPIDFRYYHAKGGNATGAGNVNLGDVYTVGTSFALSPGLDLELKGGWYNVPGPFPVIQYFRVGANVGF